MIIITGYATMEAACDAVYFEVVDFIHKPFQLDKLGAAVDFIAKPFKNSHLPDLIIKITSGQGE